uniref:Uncharacterized protein n=1 Tax=Amphimedon queenslandica TaxID=400682 RepID=A0A1X7SIW6_AMPQE
QEEYCHILPQFKGGKSPKTFRKGLIVYSKNESHFCNIAEAPFQFHQSQRLKSLAGTFDICIIDNTNTDHVRCHDLRKEDFRYQAYESNKHLVAVLLINSKDTLTLDPELPLDNIVITVPVYVISSADGDRIIENSSTNSSACQCKFMFSEFEENDESEIKKERVYSQFPESKVAVPNELVRHLRTYLFSKEKHELLTIGSFQVLMSAFTSAELTKSSTDVVDAVNELNDNIHAVYNKEFLFLIVLMSQLKRYL